MLRKYILIFYILGKKVIVFDPYKAYSLIFLATIKFGQQNNRGFFGHFFACYLKKELLVFPSAMLTYAKETILERADF